MNIQFVCTGVATPHRRKELGMFSVWTSDSGVQTVQYRPTIPGGKDPIWRPSGPLGPIGADETLPIPWRFICLDPRCPLDVPMSNRNLHRQIAVMVAGGDRKYDLGKRAAC